MKKRKAYPQFGTANGNCSIHDKRRAYILSMKGRERAMVVAIRARCSVSQVNRIWNGKSRAKK